MHTNNHPARGERLLLVALAALLAAPMPGCSRQPGDPPASAAPPGARPDAVPRPAPTLAQMARASYAGILEAPVRLSDGRFEGPPYVPGGASRPIVALIEDQVAFGDIDGDGSDEGVVLLVEDSGGSGTHIYLAVVGMREGQAANLATAQLGDRVQVRSLQVTDRRVRIELLDHRPGDPACCPGRSTVQEWQLRDGSLAKVATNSDPADAPPAARTYRGTFVWGHESRSFTECGSGREGWLLDGTGGRLVEVYDSLAAEPYQTLYAVVRGRWLAPSPTGFAADYGERFEVLDLRRAEHEGFGCREDLAGIEYVAHGNEPSWRVEIRATGIVFTSPGRFDRLEFPPPGRANVADAQSFTSAGEGDPPIRIEIEVTERPCIDAMSGSRYSYAAAVRLDELAFAGCAAAGW